MREGATATSSASFNTISHLPRFQMWFGTKDFIFFKICIPSKMQPYQLKIDSYQLFLPASDLKHTAAVEKRVICNFVVPTQGQRKTLTPSGRDLTELTVLPLCPTGNGQRTLLDPQSHPFEPPPLFRELMTGA